MFKGVYYIDKYASNENLLLKTHQYVHYLWCDRLSSYIFIAYIVLGRVGIHKIRRDLISAAQSFGYKT